MFASTSNPASSWRSNGRIFLCALLPQLVCIHPNKRGFSKSQQKLIPRPSNWNTHLKTLRTMVKSVKVPDSHWHYSLMFFQPFCTSSSFANSLPPTFLCISFLNSCPLTKGNNTKPPFWTKFSYYQSVNKH